VGVFRIVIQFNYSVIGLRNFTDDLFVAEETPVRSAVSKPMQRAKDGPMDKVRVDDTHL
jgi:hypothetical protein